MKQKIIAIVLLGFITLAADAAGKFAFINPGIILEKSPQAISATKTLEQEFKQRELDLRALATGIQEREKNYQNDSAIMSADQKKKIEDEIIQNKRKFQFDQQSLKEDLQLRRKQLIQNLQKEITAVIREYGRSNGYDFIFTEGVAYASESVDITDIILKELAK